MNPKFIHVDMDAFYASVEQLDCPELCGQPVIVGGSVEERGVVAAASYEARRFGVHSAMPMTEARRLCPRGVFLKSRMSRYVQVSHRIREIFHRYTPLVQPLSLDEAYLDVRGCERLFGDAEGIGRRIKAEIKAEIGLVASVGVAPNKFLAKLASEAKKPDGFTVVYPDRAMEFLRPLPVERLFGVGPAAVQKLHRWGLRTVAQLQDLSEKDVQARLGDWGHSLWSLAHGEDTSPVIPDREAKSLSAETTFSRDISDANHLKTALYRLVEQVGRRLRQKGLVGRTVQLKVRWPSFKLMTRHRSLPCPTNLDEDIFTVAWQLAIENTVPGRSVRLLGVGLENLEVETQAMQSWLFAPLEEKRRVLAKTQDRLREKYGDTILQHARALGLSADPAPETGNSRE